MNVKIIKINRIIVKKIITDDFKDIFIKIKLTQAY